MFSATFIERPRFSFVISILIVLVGLISIVKLPIALYPEVTPPQISVSAYYPGASSEVIAKMVGVPIEDEINDPIFRSLRLVHRHGIGKGDVGEFVVRIKHVRTCVVYH